MVAAVGGAFKLSGTISRDGYTQCSGAKAACLCAFRGHCGGCDYVAAGKNRRFTQLGLSLLLVARCLTDYPRAGGIGLHGGSGELPDMALARHAADPAGAA